MDYAEAKREAVRLANETGKLYAILPDPEHGYQNKHVIVREWTPHAPFRNFMIYGPGAKLDAQ